MNLFKTKMTAVDDSKVTTVNKMRVGWNKGLKGAQAMSDEGRAKLSALYKGKKRPAWVVEKVKAALSEKIKGVKISAEHCAKISAANKGRKHPAWIVEKVKAGRAASMARKKALGIPAGYSKGQIHTPNGVFNGRIELVSHLKEIGIPNAEKKVYKWLKMYPEHYYYIKDAK